MTGVQATKMRTPLGTTLHRILHHEAHVPLNKVTQTITQSATTATITEYRIDGTPLPTESLQVVKGARALPTYKLYYTAVSTPELEHWLLHIRHGYNRLNNAGYLQLNNWSTLGPALNWVGFLEFHATTCNHIQDSRAMS